VPTGVNVQDDLGTRWDAIALTEQEDEVVAALRIITPDVQRLSFVQQSRESRVPIVKIGTLEEPVAMRSLGDGMSRVFSIILALVNARDGLLLIDEAENGIHYKTQPKLWSIIGELAEQYNVQVFATTHSFDCVRAFAEMAKSHHYADAVLHRLENRDGSVEAVPFSAAEVSIAARDSIEIR
jgi:predicted ATPase